ncbi:MAG: hypothetical protein MJZ35_09185 [Bacteroidaceae bacterium]|nr:hypothetical protein [Bacteroidaceae bacterium]
MKKIITTALLLLLAAVTATAQRDVTKFLGIPVDGYKPQMKQKLIDKGFSYNSVNDAFTGEFNGNDVNLFIVTNNNKVCRIMVCDANTVSETDIKIRFNRLCAQFEKNKRYVSRGDQKIPEDEDISYEMVVHNKRYEAVFYQTVEDLDTVEVRKAVREKLLEKYTEEQLDNLPTALQEQYQYDYFMATSEYIADLLFMKKVWFMITEYYGKYYIAIFYDNEYNRADGEDL